MSDRPRDERRDYPDRDTMIDERGREPDSGTEDNEARRDAGLGSDVDERGDVDDRRDDPNRGSTIGRNPNDRGKWVSALIALAGLWLIVEPFLLEEALLGNVWNDVIVGVLLIVLGGYNYYRRTNEQLGNTAVAGLVALLGLWLVVSPFVYGDAGAAEMTNDLGFWNDIVVGLIVIGLGAYSAYEARELEARTTATERERAG